MLYIKSKSTLEQQTQIYPGVFSTERGDHLLVLYAATVREIW